MNLHYHKSQSSWGIKSLKRITAVIALLLSLDGFTQTYYVDAVAGNDSNSGTAITQAWKSLNKVNNTTFVPGSKILFKSNGIWIGQLSPKGSGSAANPIIIDQYGTGNKPLINGNGLTGTGVLNFINQSYWEVNNLEIINNSSTEGDRLGVKITANNGLTNRHIHLKNLSIHDIFGMYTFEMRGKNTGGIGVRITGGGSATRFDDLLIEGCEIYNIVRVGISSHSIYGNAKGNQPITNMIVRNNSIHHTAGDGLILRATDRAVVEYNVAYENHNASEAKVSYGVALWCRSADNTIFQFNEVYNTRGGADGQAFDADLEAYKTVVQYNYSHDNEGGFMLVYGTSSGAEVRYNISENDGKIGNHIFDFPEWSPPRGSARIYNNTIYIPAGNNAVISDQALATSSFLNNIIYNYGNGVPNIASQGQTAVWDYNCYVGNSNKPNDPHLISADPMLVAPGTGGNGMNTVDGYKLKQGSPALNSGTMISNNGGRDYFGNTVSATSNPHRGAYNGIAIATLPVADFTSDRTIVCSSSAVTFTNASTGNITSFHWNFGDGAVPATATGAGPHTVTYTTSGLKTVSLNVSNSSGSDTEIKSGFITVNQTPVTSSITGPTEVCLNDPSNIIYSVTSHNGSTYQWSVPAEAVIVSGAGTHSIVVDIGTQSGVVSVKETNQSGCHGTTVTQAVTVRDCNNSNTILLSPIHDAYVRDGSYASNAFGTSDPMNLVSKNSGALNNGFNREILLTFDLSSLAGTIDKAVLELYCTTPSDPVTVVVYSAANSGWTEGTVTWNTKPVQGNQLATTVINGVGVYSWDLTTYLKSAQSSGLSKVSLVVRNATVSTPQINWNSKEVSSEKPRLKINVSTVSSKVLTATKDAYVRDGSYAATALGVTDPKALVTKRTGVTNDGFNRESYLSFDITSLTEVNTAHLKLFGGISGGDPVTVAVYSVANNTWTENTITWNTKPVTSATSVASTQVLPGAAQYHTWDVTQLLQSAKASGQTQVSFCIRNSTIVLNGPQAIWNSKESGINPPQLEINTTQLKSSITEEVNTAILASPNPFTAELEISTAFTLDTQSKVIVTDRLGNTLVEVFPATTNMLPTVLDLSALPSGIYFLHILSRGEVYTEKIVKVTE